MSATFAITGPLGLGDLLDGAFRLYRSRFVTLILTTSVVMVPLALAATFAVGGATSSYMALLAASMNDQAARVPAGGFASVAGLYGLTLLVSIAAFVGSLLVFLALAEQTLAALHGSQLSVWQGYRLGARRFWSFLGMSLLVGLAIGSIAFAVYVGLIFAFVAIAFAAAALTASVSNNDAAIIGAIVVGIILVVLALVVLLAPIAFLASRWIAAPAAVVAEKLGPVRALGRSWNLTRRRFWRCLGYLVLLAVLNIVLVLAPIYLTQFVALILLATLQVYWFTGLIAGVSYLINIFWFPFAVIAIMLIYFDLRVRSESYDVEMQLQAMEADLRPTNLP